MWYDTRFISFAVLPIVVLILIVVVVVAFTRRSLPDGTALLTPRRLVEAYVFTVILVSMLFVSSGLGDLVQAGIAHYAGLEASYRPTPTWEDAEKAPTKVKYEYDQNAPRRSLIAGSAQLGVGLFVGILHLFGLRRLGRSEPLVVSPVYRLFVVTGVVIYTTATLAYAVASVRDFLLYRYVPTSAPQPRWWYNHPIPGEQLGGLVGFLPLWAILVALLFRYARSRSVPA